MLNISFFITAFSSIFWLIYSLRFINIQALSTGNTELLFQSLIIILLPIALVWGVFSVIKSHFTEQKVFHCLYNSLNQIRKNIEDTTELSQNLVNTQSEIKNGFLFQEFNFLISDINEILSDIIKRSNSVSSAQLEHLWAQTSGGERWIMAKTFIEIVDYQSEFSSHLRQKALKDSLLKGNILEFCARYKTIKALLKNSHNEIFYNIIVSGALGKTFDILNSIAENLSSQDLPPSYTEKNTRQPEPVKQNFFKPAEENLEFPSFLSNPENNTPDISPAPIKIEPTMDKSEETDDNLKAIRDEILALEPPETEEEHIIEHITPAPVITGFTQTQMALRDIKNSAQNKPETEKRTPIISLEELEKEINSSPENNYDEYAYPFGAWLDGKKNK